MLHTVGSLFLSAFKRYAARLSTASSHDTMMNNAVESVLKILVDWSLSKNKLALLADVVNSVQNQKSYDRTIPAPYDLSGMVSSMVLVGFKRVFAILNRFSY